LESTIIKHYEKYNTNIRMEINSIKQLVILSKDLEEYVGYLTYSVNPIGTYPSKEIIKEDVENIRTLLNKIEDLL